ncbi:MAG TPA: PH domain-containing protein [Candidatus Limnocylindrales bacterium]
MSYADSLLATGERILHRERQHWLVLLWGARLPIVAMVLGVLLLVLSSAVTDLFSQIVFWAGAALFVGGLAFLVWATLRYLNQEYVLTNRRVIEVQGVVNKRSTDSSLEKINDAILTQSIFGRIFGFGDLEVLTASEAGIERFQMIVNPILFKKAMMDAKHEYEQDMSGSYRAPGPPIRDLPPAPPQPAVTHEEVVASEARVEEPAPAPELTPAPVFVAPPEVSAPPPSIAAAPALPATPPAELAPAAKADPDEITRTLANLADLRDRGAISADDYEAKKADLLGRL